MKKGMIYEGIVKKVDFPNRGTVVSDEGEAVVKDVITGQRVSFMVTKKRNGRCEGRLINVTEKSSLENAEQQCMHFGECGGCTYRSMGYDEQLRMKEDQVHKIIDNVCTDYEFMGISGSPVRDGYRNKMEFTFGDEVKNGPLALGMHKKGSFYDIVTVSGCLNVDEDYRKIIRATVDFFEAEHLPFYHKLSHEGFLRNLLVRKGTKTGEILIDIITTSAIEYDFTKYADMLNGIIYDGTIAGILHTVNDSVADAVINQGTSVIYGRDCIYEEILGLRFKITPFSFFQTNSSGAEVLYSITRDFAGDTSDKVIFDLYSGTGTIAQILAPVAKKVVGVEIVAEAVEAAKVNAALNGLGNCEFIAGDVLEVIDNLTDKPDMIILDPPREGIHPKAIEKIADYGVDTIVYVSCKPTSLARDIVIFEARGYKVIKAACVDMFPGTVHVETVVLLSLIS